MDTPSGKSAMAMDETDRISGLPDEVRQHILSFLPASDAVRTCALSTRWRWRHLWASAPRLNIDAKGFTSQSSFIKFVDALLISRGCIPLKSFWLRADGPDIFLDNFRDTAYLWICYALRNNVEELGLIDQWTVPELFQLHYCPLTSSCLKKLYLCYVSIDDHAIKKLFSGCPALEDLEMSLVTASICLNDAAGQATFADGCKILRALSNVRKLELLIPWGVECEYSVQDDTHLCGVVFANLITLSLSDWCLYDNCKPLLYLLEHSPNLEKLTLKMTQLHFREYLDSSFTAAAVVSATQFNCEKLRNVEIICPKGDTVVGMLLTMLLTKLMSPPVITIKPF
ncbi:unnamed protein product [Urochloa decumbens]|uniref:F-box domain-containing protein n=1 Tax=Urochloa decumbens TaxID=240449 RepID=A0ABC9BY37_9POAL